MPLRLAQHVLGDGLEGTFDGVHRAQRTAKATTCIARAGAVDTRAERQPTTLHTLRVPDMHTASLIRLEGANVVFRTLRWSAYDST